MDAARWQCWRGRRAWGVVLLLTGALSLAGGRARAQSDEELALARQWFKEADAAEKKKDYEGALALFRKAAQVKETPQLLLRIGSCQERLGDPVAALVSYERALERSGLAGADKARVEDAAKELIEGVRGRIATLTIAPKEAYKDLSVKLDGAPLATAALGDKLPLNPGTHKLTAEAPGRRPFEESFSVAAKETKTVAIELAVDPAATAASPTPSATAGGAPNGPGTPDRGGGPGPLPVALLVGGGAAVVGGVVFLVVSAVRGDSIDEECGGPERKACPKSRTKDINDEIQGVKNFQILGGVIGGVGVIAAGVGTALLLTAPSAHAASTGKGVWVAPAVSVSGIGVAARGTF